MPLDQPPAIIEMVPTVKSIAELKSEYHRAIESEQANGFFFWANTFSPPMTDEEVQEYRATAKRAADELRTEGYTRHLEK